MATLPIPASRRPNCSAFWGAANVASWHEPEVAPLPGDFRYQALSRHPLAEVRFFGIFVRFRGLNGPPSGNR